MKIKTGFTCLVLVLYQAANALAQEEKPGNLPKFEERKYHFGFMLGANQSNYVLAINPGSPLVDSINPGCVPKYGFNLAVSATYHILPFLHARFSPGLDFEERKLKYTYKGRKGFWYTEEMPVESTWLNFPLCLKLNTRRIHNIEAYALAGGFYAFDMAKPKEPAATTWYEFKTTGENKGYTLGGGLDFFTQYFKLGMELKYNAGVGNILKQTNSFYSAPLESVNTRSWVLSLTFEG